MKKKYPCIESTYEFSTNGYKVRLWIDEKELKDIDSKIIDKLKSLAGKSKAELIDWCAANIPNVTAIQVIDADGKGIVAYTVNFTDDPHG